MNQRIKIIPQSVTYEQVINLRIRADMSGDPDLYNIVAAGFDVLDMPASAESARVKRDYYRMVENEKPRSL